MSKQENMATQEALAEAINEGDLDKMDDLFTADVVGHGKFQGIAPTGLGILK